MKNLIALVVGSVAAVSVLRAVEPPAPSDGLVKGELLYQQRCATCHDHPQEQIPPRALISIRPHDQIVQTMVKGVMQAQAQGLSAAEIDTLADYLNSIADASATDKTRFVEYDIHANMAASPAPPFVIKDTDWNGWSPDLENTRYKTNSMLRRENVPGLRPKWVFAYPGGRASGPPSVVGGRVFIGSNTGAVFSLDAKTGSTYWAISPGVSAVRTSIIVQKWSNNGPSAAKNPRFAAYFGDAMGVVYAVDAETGELIWSTRPAAHPYAGISGSFKLHEGRLYVPIMTAREGSAARDGKYEACTLRGSVVVLDSVTGKTLWQGYTITEAPKPYKVNSLGTQMYGPAGASVWSPPTLDPAAGKVYAATGQSRTMVPEDGSDAIMAFDLRTGVRLWSMQATANDAWLAGCEPPTPGPNCPDDLGPDVDFGSPAILKTLAGGRRILVGAQKSGMVHALDPDDNGRVLWRLNLAKDANIPPGVILRDRDNPGIVFGMAADDRKLYAAIADPSKEAGHVPLGVYAVDLATGTIAWRAPGKPVPNCSAGEKGCMGAQRTAVTLIPGVVFAGCSDAHMYAYDSDTGKVIWDFDTGRPFRAVNGAVAWGGAIEGSATVVADDSLYVMSGYGNGGRGNALICFSLDGKME